MYLTQNDLINFQLENNNNVHLSDIITDLIRKDLESQEKKDMLDGENYYKCKHDILDIDFQEFVVDGITEIDKNAANNRIVNAYDRILKDQKAGYICGKQITWDGDENDIDYLNNTIGDIFHKRLREWIIGTSNHGREYWHIYIDELQNFRYVQISGIEIIPIYDTSFQDKLIGIFRYYPITYQKTITSPEKTIYKVQIYNENEVYYFIQDPDSMKYVPDPDEKINPKPHLYITNTAFPNVAQKRGWGKVPFIELRNNDEMQGDLTFTKSLIDAYDFDMSKFTNDLADIAQAVWVLKGYEGTSLGEFMKDLRHFKAIKLNKDGGADSKQNEVPNEAFDSSFDRIEDNIFVAGMGVNPKMNRFGANDSGVKLKFMYALLDIKANITITETTAALKEFLWFVSEYATLRKDEFNYEDIKPIFNKTILINESERITDVATSVGDISLETSIANHPWVTDVAEELKRIEEERSKNMDLNSLPPVIAPVNNKPIDNIPVKDVSKPIK